MNIQTPWRILIVAEGPSDRRRLRSLMDHLIHRHSNDIDLSTFRCFESFRDESYIQIKQIPTLVRKLGLDRRYSAGGLKGDGATLRKLYQLLQKEARLGSDLVIVWGRDDDGDERRRDDAMQAKQRLLSPPTLLIAIASECGEAWAIAGWRAKTDDETSLRGELQRQFGFDPCSHPERLSHKHDAPKSAKRVLNTLFGQDEDRETTALVVAIDNETSIRCGLQAFCDEVDTWLSDAAQREYMDPDAEPDRSE